jgi:hypothetical protein
VSEAPKTPKKRTPAKPKATPKSKTVKATPATPASKKRKVEDATIDEVDEDVEAKDDADESIFGGGEGLRAIVAEGTIDDYANGI